MQEREAAPAARVVSGARRRPVPGGHHPPATAPKALQMHVSQLRRLLDPDILVTRPPGYELHVAGDELDLERFETAGGRARAASRQRRPQEAADLLASALALWRGSPLADLGSEEFLQPE